MAGRDDAAKNMATRCICASAERARTLVACARTLPAWARRGIAMADGDAVRRVRLSTPRTLRPPQPVDRGAVYLTSADVTVRHPPPRRRLQVPHVIAYGRGLH